MDFYDEVSSIANKVKINVTDSPSGYSQEWMTMSCIGSAFKSIRQVISNFEGNRGSLLRYLRNAEAIAKEAEKSAPEVPKTKGRRSGGTSGGSKKRDAIPVGTVMQITKDTYLRKGKGTDTKALVKLPIGTQLLVVKDDLSGWIEVIMPDKTTGYVKFKLLEEVKNKGA